MERSHRVLLVAGLLAALLPAAAATFGPKPGAPCEPTLLATQVALFCAPDMPTAQCCDPVVAAVDLGGGVPCLCRVAAEPQLVMAGLNATHLLTLYTSCGGLRPGGAHLSAACEGPAPPAAVVSIPPPPPPSPAPRRKQPAQDASPLPSAAVVSSPAPPSSALHRKQPARNLEDSCNAFLLARPLVDTCRPVAYKPPKSCCANVVKIVERDCLCSVTEVPEVMVSALDTIRLWQLYSRCGGTLPVPSDRTDCEVYQSPPPPPSLQSPPPPLLSPPPPSPSKSQTSTADNSGVVASSVSESWQHVSRLVTHAPGLYIGVGCFVAFSAALAVGVYMKFRRSDAPPARAGSSAATVQAGPKGTWEGGQALSSWKDIEMTPRVLASQPSVSRVSPSQPGSSNLRSRCPGPVRPPHAEVPEGPAPSAPPAPMALLVSD